MPNKPRPPNENHILSRLPRKDYERLRPHLEQVELQHSQVIHEAGQVIEYVYSPQNAMISLISHTVEGESVEVGGVGFEGMIGISTVLGVDKSLYEAMVQIPNGGKRMHAEVLREEFKRGGALHDMLLRYTQALLLLHKSPRATACILWLRDWRDGC